MYFGAEAFSTNLLKQRVLTVSDNFEINVGKHNISMERTMNFLTLKMCLLEETLGIRYSALQDFG
jgi:hypothetical protein